MEDIIYRVAKTIRKYELIDKGDKVLIGFSGGPDSVALMYVLHSLHKKLKISLSAVYINHHLRPRAAKREARFGETICAKYGIPFACEDVNIPELSQKNKTGIEETARIYRYRTLERLAAQQACSKIAIGHHRDDRAETVIFNLLRGSGRMGVAGIPVRRGKIIRPLYEISRAEIADFLEENGLKYMTDRSNYSRKYTRNRIRRKIIPMMQREVSEAAIENIIRFSEIVAEEESYLGSVAADYYDKLVSKTPGGKIRLDLSGKLAYDTWLKRRLVFKLLAAAGLTDIEFAEVERVVDVIDHGRRTRLALREDWIAEIAGDHLYIYRPGNRISDCPVALPGQCKMDYPRVWLSFEYVDKSKVKELTASTRNVAYIDAEKIQGRLHLSGLKRGARFRPYGRPGSKKAGDFLTDRKYPRPLRDELPVLYDESGIVWMAGLEIDHRVRVQSETGKIIKIEIGED